VPSRSARQAGKREKGLWQRRYWEHAVRDETDLQRHIDYIHFNPVKHGLVSRVADWPHSSFHQYVRREELPADWGGDVREIAGSFGE
jgi:putative transposase